MAETDPSPSFSISVPRYIINLDLPPEHRWTQVVDDYKEKWNSVEEYGAKMINKIVGPMLGPTVDAIIKATLKSLASRAHYAAEMKALASRAGMDLGRLVMMQHIYEASAACTSIVVQQGESCPVHIRSMDWEMDILKPLTIELDFQKNGESVFYATTWAGFLGVFTGMRPGEWSSCLNFRSTESGSLWKNLTSMLKGAIPSGFLLRNLLETEPSYDVALDTLATEKLVAPCFYTICGSQPGQGAIITRDSTTELNRWLLTERGHLIQTNIDHWSDGSNDVLFSCARREAALSALDNAPSPITQGWLWETLSAKPICNSITIYGTLMIPAQRIFISRLPNSSSTFTPSHEVTPADGTILIPSDASVDQYLQLVTVHPLPAASTCSR